GAPIGKVHFGNTPIEDILDIRGFNLNATLELDPDFLEDSEHEHDEHVSSFVFRSDQPFDSAKLEEFLSGVVQIYGPDMLRYKGNSSSFAERSEEHTSELQSRSDLV